MTEWYEDQDSLWSYLQENKDKIWYVQLIWTWPEVIETETDLCFMKDGTPWSLYARWIATRTDPEYTFIGSIDDAIEFATKYDCWDREMMEDKAIITDGILFREYEGYNTNGDEYPEKDPADETLYNLEYIGLYFYDNYKSHFYHSYYKEPPIRWPKGAY